MTSRYEALPGIPRCSILDSSLKFLFPQTQLYPDRGTWMIGLIGQTWYPQGEALALPAVYITTHSSSLDAEALPRHTVVSISEDWSPFPALTGPLTLTQFMLDVFCTCTKQVIFYLYCIIFTSSSHTQYFGSICEVGIKSLSIVGSKKKRTSNKPLSTTPHSFNKYVLETFWVRGTVEQWGVIHLQSCLL